MYLDDTHNQSKTKKDIWALGCILYKIFFGREVIKKDSENRTKDLMDLKNPEKIDELVNFKPNPEEIYFDFLKFDTNVQNLIRKVIRSCLEFDSYTRPSSLELLLEI